MIIFFQESMDGFNIYHVRATNCGDNVHKVIKSHRSLLMLLRVKVFAIECIYPVKVVWVVSKQLLVS